MTSASSLIASAASVLREKCGSVPLTYPQSQTSCPRSCSMSIDAMSEPTNSGSIES